MNSQRVRYTPNQVLNELPYGSVRRRHLLSVIRRLTKSFNGLRVNHTGNLQVKNDPDIKKLKRKGLIKQVRRTHCGFTNRYTYLVATGRGWI
jgi:hypothetical protein